MPVRKKTPLEGELDSAHAEFDVPDILLSVCETEGTGLLTFSTPEAEKTLFVRDGSYIFAKSSSMDDRLGEYLLRTQRVALRDLASISKMVRPGKRLGALLVEGDALDPKGLVQSVVGQVRSIVLSLFRWTKAEYRFVEQELPSKETITLNMPTAQLIVDGIREIDSWWRIERGIGELDSFYRAVPGLEEALRSVELDTPALGLLAMLSKAKRIRDACTDSSLSEMEVCKLLWAFRSLGWVESVEDDGTALLDNWQVDEESPPAEAPAQPEPAVPEPAVAEPAVAVHASPALAAADIPMPALVEPIADSGHNGDAPSFESDTGLPFSQDSDQPFPPASPASDDEQTVLLQPSAAGVDPAKAPEAANDPQAKQEPDSELPVMDPDMDMEGLSEALKGDSSK